jgi:hypothetical protein
VVRIGRAFTGAGRRAAKTDGTDSPHRDPVEEEDVSKVDRGKAFLSCYPLHQPSDLQGELNRKIHEPVRDANQSDSGNDVSYNGLADLGVVVVRYHSQDQPHARQKGDCP